MPIRLHLTTDGEGYVKNDVKNALKDLQKNIDDYKLKNTTLTAEYKTLLQDLEEFSKKYETLDKQHRFLLRRVETGNKEDNKSDDLLSEENLLSIDDEQLDLLMGEKEQLKKDISIWRDKYRDEVQSLKNIIKNLKNENESLVSELNQIQIKGDNTLDDWKLKAIKLERSLKDEQAKNSVLTDEIRDVEKLLDEKDSTSSNTQEKEKKTNVNTLKLENENNRLKKRNSSLQNDLDHALEKLSTEKKEASQAKRVAKNLEIKVSELEKQYQSTSELSDNLAVQLNAKESLNDNEYKSLFHDIIQSLSEFFSSEELIADFKRGKNSLNADTKLEPLLENVQITINKVIDNHRKEMILSLGSVASDQQDIKKLTTLLNKSAYILNNKKYNNLTKAIKDLVLFALRYFQDEVMSVHALGEIEKRFGSLKTNSKNLEEALNVLQEEKESMEERNEKTKRENEFLKREIIRVKDRYSKARTAKEKQRFFDINQKFDQLSDAASRTRLEMATLSSLVKSTAEELTNTSKHIDEKLTKAEETASSLEGDVRKYRKRIAEGEGEE